jgi:hypothetical protein
MLPSRSDVTAPTTPAPVPSGKHAELLVLGQGF